MTAIVQLPSQFSWLVTAAARRLSGDETFLTRTEGASQDGARTHCMTSIGSVRAPTYTVLRAIRELKF